MSAESPPVRARREVKLIVGSLALVLALAACTVGGVGLAVYSYRQPLVPHRPDPSAPADPSAPRGGWPNVVVRARELGLDPNKTYPAFALGATPDRDRLAFTWSPGRRPAEHGRLPDAVSSPSGDGYAVVDMVDPQATLVLRVAYDGTTHAIPLDDRFGQGSWFPSLAWSPSGERLAVALRDGSIRVVDARSGRAKDVPRSAVASGVDPLDVVAWPEAGLMLAAEDSATEVLLVDVDAAEVTRRVALPVASSSRDLHPARAGRFLLASYEARDDLVGGSQRGAYVVDLALDTVSGVQGSGYDSWETPLQVAWSPGASHFVGFAIDRPTVVTASTVAQKGRNVGRLQLYRRDGALVREWDLAPLFARVPGPILVTELTGLFWGADGYVYLVLGQLGGQLARLDPTQPAPPTLRALGTAGTWAAELRRTSSGVEGAAVGSPAD